MLANRLSPTISYDERSKIPSMVSISSLRILLCLFLYLSTMTIVMNKCNNNILFIHAFSLQIIQPFYHHHTNNRGSVIRIKSSSKIIKTSLSESLKEMNRDDLNNNNDNELTTQEDDVDIEYIKTKLMEYLEKRKEVNADELAKENIGKIVGGTKGNLVLDYISGSPNKEKIIERSSYPFDYDELTKYGYGSLITPIMKAGGRLRMYEILGLTLPPTLLPKKKTSTSSTIVIDRDGSKDPKRYKGLKLGDAYNDMLQGEKLQQALNKQKQQEKNNDSVNDMNDNVDTNEVYQIPFSEKRNTLPKSWTPDWTVERLDEYTKRQGAAQSWVRNAKDGLYIQDPYETFYFTNILQLLYCIILISSISISYGKSTTTFISLLTNLIYNSDSDNIDNTNVLLSYLQGPALIIFIISIGCSVYSTTIATQKNRNVIMWLWKGFFGGPFTIQSIQNINTLITQGEKRQQDQEDQQQDQ